MRTSAPACRVRAGRAALPAGTWPLNSTVKTPSNNKGGLGGARACPPEDCGGVGGYENLVTVMQTPTHEEYQSTLQWLGGRFDPEKFDPTQVRFDDPTRRYELALEKPSRRSHRAGRTRPDNTRLQRSRARRARR